MAGRKRHAPTSESRKTAESASGLGLPQAQICSLIGDIDEKTLRKHYRKELSDGKAKANGQVVKSLYSSATSGDTTAAIWWTKTQLGWKDTSRVELGGIPGGVPIAIASMSPDDVNWNQLNDEEVAAIAAGKMTNELITKLTAAARADSA